MIQRFTGFYTYQVVQDSFFWLADVARKSKIELSIWPAGRVKMLGGISWAFWVMFQQRRVANERSSLVALVANKKTSLLFFNSFIQVWKRSISHCPILWFYDILIARLEAKLLLGPYGDNAFEAVVWEPDSGGNDHEWLSEGRIRCVAGNKRVDIGKDWFLSTWAQKILKLCPWICLTSKRMDLEKPFKFLSLDVCVPVFWGWRGSRSQGCGERMSWPSPNWFRRCWKRLDVYDLDLTPHPS